MATSHWVVAVLFCALLIQGHGFNGNHKRISPSNTVAFQRIETSMKAAGRNVQKRIEQLTEYIISEKGSSEVETVGWALEKVSRAVTDISTADILNIVSGIIEARASLVALIPVVGPVFSAAFSVIANIFDTVGKLVGEDSGSIVRKEIEKALNLYDDAQLRAEAEGTKLVYSISHAYLSAMVNRTLSEHEVSTMAAHVPIYGGVKFLGILQNKVIERSKSTNVEQVKQAMEYTKLYVILAVLRSGLLWEMYSIVRTVPNFENTAEAIRRVAQLAEKNDIDFLMYLSKPDYSRSVFFAYFNPSEWPVIEKYFEKDGLLFQKLDNLTIGTHYLSPKEWPNCYMYMMANNEAWIGGMYVRANSCRFSFSPVSQKDNIFYMRSVEWPDWYIYMQQNSEGGVRGIQGKPGPEGQWKIVKYEDGTHLLSSRQWPNWFMYMKNTAMGNVRGWQNDPGPQGHWIIE